MEYNSTSKDKRIKRSAHETAVLYIRVSSKDQINNFSIPTQLKECRAYLTRNNIEEVGVFIEKGESAKTAYRTQFQNLLAFVNKNKNRVDYLLCYKFDRFSRSSEDFHYYKSLLARYGTKVKSITENTQDTPEGRFLESIYAGIAQFDNENKGERVKACLATKALDGWYPGYAPYGYKNDKETHLLVRDRRYYDHIKYCLKQFAKGVTTSELVEELKSRGIETMGRGESIPKEFTTKKLWRILNKSRFYAGVFDWAENKDIKGKHDKMITWNEHLKIQERLYLKPSSIVRDVNDLFVLNFSIEKGLGFLRCTNCGLRMKSCKARGRGGVYRYYYCPNRSCLQLKKSVPQVVLERLVGDSLRILQPTPVVVDLFKEVVKEEWDSNHKDISKRNIEIKRRLEQLKREKAETIAMRRRQELELNDYNQEMDKIKCEIAEVSSSISNEQLEGKNIDTLLSNAETFLKNVEPLYKAYPIKKKRKLLEIIYPKGILYGNGECRTPKKSILFDILDTLGDSEHRMVPLRGIEPRFTG